MAIEPIEREGFKIEVHEIFHHHHKMPDLGAILRQNTKFSAKSSPSIKSGKILANLVDF
jgi:hypothetical protein